MTRQVDFSNAFVHAKMKENVYVKLPQTFISKKGPGHVLKLRKSLYGLVQAPLYWYSHLCKALKRNGLKPSEFDPCVFVGDGIVALIYVDDCIFMAKDYETIDTLIAKLQAKFTSQ